MSQENDWSHPATSRGIAEMSSIWEETLSAAMWTIEDGKVVRLALYWDTATARRAVGGF